MCKIAVSTERSICLHRHLLRHEATCTRTRGHAPPLWLQPFGDAVSSFAVLPAARSGDNQTNHLEDRPSHAPL